MQSNMINRNDFSRIERSGGDKIQSYIGCFASAPPRLRGEKGIAS